MIPVESVTIQAHVFYSGMVQGVGFRYTVLRVASEMNLYGWVRNLKDGRVEITVEGSKDLVEKLLNKIDRHFGGYISNKQFSFQDAQGKFKDFQIVL